MFKKKKKSTYFPQGKAVLVIYYLVFPIARAGYAKQNKVESYFQRKKVTIVMLSGKSLIEGALSYCGRISFQN